MIMTVESDFKYNNYIQPIKLDAANTENSFKGDCKISGYGYSQEWFKNDERRLYIKDATLMLLGPTSLIFISYE